MNRFLFYFLLLVSGNSFAQYAGLSISVRANDLGTDTFNLSDC